MHRLFTLSFFKINYIKKIGVTCLESHQKDTYSVFKMFILFTAFHSYACLQCCTIHCHHVKIALVYLIYFGQKNIIMCRKFMVGGCFGFFYTYKLKDFYVWIVHLSRQNQSDCKCERCLFTSDWLGAKNSDYVCESCLFNSDWMSQFAPSGFGVRTTLIIYLNICLILTECFGLPHSDFGARLLWLYIWMFV